MKQITYTTLVFLGALILSSGCASVHDYCMDHTENYSTYDECYQEVSAIRARRREALSHMGDGLKNHSNRNSTISCTTISGVTNCNQF